MARFPPFRFNLRSPFPFNLRHTPEYELTKMAVADADDEEKGRAGVANGVLLAFLAPEEALALGGDHNEALHGELRVRQGHEVDAGGDDDDEAWRGEVRAPQGRAYDDDAAEDEEGLRFLPGRALGEEVRGVLLLRDRALRLRRDRMGYDDEGDVLRLQARGDAEDGEGLPFRLRAHGEGLPLPGLGVGGRARLYGEGLGREDDAERLEVAVDDAEGGVDLGALELQDEEPAGGKKVAVSAAVAAARAVKNAAGKKAVSSCAYEFNIWILGDNSFF